MMTNGTWKKTSFNILTQYIKNNDFVCQNTWVSSQNDLQAGIIEMLFGEIKLLNEWMNKWSIILNAVKKKDQIYKKIKQRKQLKENHQNKPYTLEKEP